MKICIKCGLKKDLSEFHFGRTSKDKRQSACKICIGKYCKEIYGEKREFLLKQAKEYYSKNRIKIYKRTRKYLEKHREKYRAYWREWSKRNPKKVSFQSSQRAHRKRNAKGKFTYNEWENLKIKYNLTCPCCKRKEPEIKLTQDHIKSLSRGGLNKIKNIQPLCLSCNAKKGNRFIKKYESNNTKSA